MSNRIRMLLTLSTTLALCIGAMPAHAALKVLATTPDWESLTTELGGTMVNVYTATGRWMLCRCVSAGISIPLHGMSFTIS